MTDDLWLLSRSADPLIHHGRHFGQTVHDMCNVQMLITNGILGMGEDEEVSEELLTSESVLLVHLSSLYRINLLCLKPIRIKKGT